VGLFSSSVQQKLEASSGQLTLRRENMPSATVILSEAATSLRNRVQVHIEAGSQAVLDGLKCGIRHGELLVYYGELRPTYKVRRNAPVVGSDVASIDPMDELIRLAGESAIPYSVLGNQSVTLLHARRPKLSIAISAPLGYCYRVV
jgi:hypothetical protein